VIETPAGRVVPATRPHALEATVREMFGYRPDVVLAQVEAPIVAVRRVTDGDGSSAPPTWLPPAARLVEIEAPGHNLIRYRPDEVTRAILGR
jgi:pimeloyl-ACP methyl ester carboxylesterase